MSDVHKTVGAADVTDEKLLPGQFRAFANEVRGALEIFGDKIAKALTEISERVLPELDALRRDTDNNARRLDDHDKRLAALEAARPKRKART